MKVTIEVWSALSFDDKTIIYDDEQNLCLLNGNLAKTEVKKDMQVILDCLAGAPLNMSMPVIDGGGCKITIENSGENRVYRYSNSYPKGFNKVWETLERLPRYNEPSEFMKKMSKYF